MKIAQKLLLSLGGLSLLLMIGIGSNIKNSLESKTEMQLLSVVVDSGVYVGHLVHEVQVERGLTAGFLASKGEKNKEALIAQRTKVDEAWVRLEQIPFADLPKTQLESLNALIGSQEALLEKRKSVDAVTIKPAEAIAFYTATIKHGINFMNNTVSVADIARATQALRILITAKELAGQERAVGNAAFSAGKFADAAAMQRFVQLGAQRKILLDEFLTLAPVTQAEKLLQMRTGDLFIKLTFIENQAITKSFAGEALETTAADWFADSTRRINVFKEIEDELNLVIAEMAQKAVDRAGVNVWSILLLGLVVVVLIVWLYVSIVNKGIRQPLNMMVDRLANIAQSGRFNERINYVAKDEVGDAARALNQLLEQLEQVIAETNSVVLSIASGELNQRIESNYVGDLATLKGGVNTSAENIATVMNTLSDAMSVLQSGRFDHIINVSAEGQYGKMLTNASRAMHTLNLVIGEIVTVMHKMSEGDFSSRVFVDAQGDLLVMRDNVNVSMDSIASAISAINDVVGAQAQGDLTKALPSGQFKGQLHELNMAISHSSTRVKESVVQVMTASSIVNEAANQVFQGSEDLSARVQEQAAALEETSATMNEMASAVQANTANARQVANLAHQVQHQSLEGSSVMHQTINAMQSIRESSHKISDIVTLIDGIAFQTNLLALNAAVEAARAGEHGRGFAVVASEVRALAQKSAEAAKNIKLLIDDSVQRVENGTQLAEKSGQVLAGITGAVEQVARMIEEIANASNEQSIGIGQVHKAIADIDAVTQQNAALVEETTAAAESLRNEANHLQNNMSFFNTGT